MFVVKTGEPQRMSNAIGGLTTGVTMKTKVLHIKKKNQFVLSSLAPSIPVWHPRSTSLTR